MKPYLIGLAIAAILLALLPRACPAADGQLIINVTDEKTRLPVACRMHLFSANGKPRKPEAVPFWSDHFVFPGNITLHLPVGRYTFEIQRGPEYYDISGNFVIDRFANDAKDVALRRAVNMAEEGWWSGDLYVRRPVRDVELLMRADDLHVAQVLTWWNGKSDPAVKTLKLPPNRLVEFDRNRCYQVLAGGFSRAGTELLCFNLPAPLVLAGDSPEYPSIVTPLLKLREKQDKVSPLLPGEGPGVRASSERKSVLPRPHPSPLPRGEGTDYSPRPLAGEGPGVRADSSVWLDVASSYGWDVPVLVAHGLVDSIEVANSHFGRKSIQPDDTTGKPRDKTRYAGPFGYARWTQDVYFKILDCGLRIPPSAGSGSGVSPNPVGYNRVYVHCVSSFNYLEWWKNLRAGQVVVTNGPLLRPKVNGQLPGYVFQGEDGRDMELEIALTLSASDPISYLEIVQDGLVRESIRFEDYAKSGRLPKLHFKHSGWFLLRVVGDRSETYRFAMTGPYYVEMDHKPRISKKAAQFFLDWVYERARQIKLDEARQRDEVLQIHRKARDFWQDMVKRANVE